MDSDYSSRSEEETFEIAEKIGRNFTGGEIILLRGPLGVGKTIFTKGLLDAMGFDAAEVTSPSFALVNHYQAKLDVFHIDLWRLDSAADPAFEVGLDEILEEEKAVVVVEWSERLNGYEFPRPVISIEISGSGDSVRTISVSGN